MRNNIEMCLGRLHSPYDHRTLRLDRFLEAKLSPMPVESECLAPITNWGVMGNNRYGNCVTVAAAHFLMNWMSSKQKKQVTIPDEAVIIVSREIGGLNGFNILERNRIWRKKGLFGDNLWAFVSVDLNNSEHVRAAIHILGGLDIGVNLPNAWRGADKWETGNGSSYRPGSWGGHSVPIVAYDFEWVYCVSWGEVIPMSWDALRYYCDEAYAFIDKEWFSGDGANPLGLNLEAMHDALLTIDQGDSLI